MICSPSQRPEPIWRNNGWKMLIDCPSEMMKATPRNAAMVPSVAMTALTRPTVTISPLTTPARPPTTSPNRMPSAADPVCCTPSAMQTVERPTTAPTEMSRPPETMTIVCAVARMPRIAIP